MGWFCPDDFELNQKSIDWAKHKGLSDGQIRDELEAMKDYEYPKKRTDWDRCFRTWIRNGFAWGRISVTQQLDFKPYKPQQLTPEQKEEEDRKWREEMKRFGVRTIK